MQIAKVLDLGADGIIVPQVNTPQQAADAVRFARYPPDGTRGVGLARAHGYGSKFKEYVESANREIAVIVQADMKGKGVASHLMQRLIDWARGRGMGVIVGQVLADNAPMLAFVRRLGFTVKRMAGEPDVMDVRLTLI